jgi:hypothetical protein
MAYFVFNPQTNSLDDSDHPTPIRKNLGEKLLAEKPGWQYAPWQDYPEDDDIPSVQKMATGGLARKGHFMGTVKPFLKKPKLKPGMPKPLDIQELTVLSSELFPPIKTTAFNPPVKKNLKINTKPNPNYRHFDNKYILDWLGGNKNLNDSSFWNGIQELLSRGVTKLEIGKVLYPNMQDSAAHLFKKAKSRGIKLWTRRAHQDLGDDFKNIKTPYKNWGAMIKDRGKFKKRIEDMEATGFDFDQQYTQDQLAKILGIEDIKSSKQMVEYLSGGVESSDLVKGWGGGAIKKYNARQLINNINKHLTKKDKIAKRGTPVEDLQHTEAFTLMRNPAIQAWDSFKSLRNKSLAPKNFVRGQTTVNPNYDKKLHDIWKKYNLSDIQEGHTFPKQFFFLKPDDTGKALSNVPEFDWIRRNKDILIGDEAIALQSKAFNEDVLMGPMQKLRPLYKKLGEYVNKYQGKDVTIPAVEKRAIEALNKQIDEVVEIADNRMRDYLMSDKGKKDLLSQQYMTKGALSVAKFDPYTKKVFKWNPYKERSVGLGMKDVDDLTFKLNIQSNYKSALANSISSNPKHPDRIYFEKWMDEVMNPRSETIGETAVIFKDRAGRDQTHKPNYAEGGIVPRIGYRDGPTLGDARGWENMLDLSDPDVVAKLEALKVLQDQKTMQNRMKAHENRFLHRSDDYYTSQEESFIPHYVQDVAKTTFGTSEGRKYFGSKLAEGAVEGTEWLVMQIPHLLKQVNPVGLLNLQKEMKEGNFSWMDLLYEPKLGEKWGMNKYQQQKLEELRDQAVAEGKPGIPQGVETLGTTGELGAMFADPFMMYAGYRKLAPHLKTKKRGIEEQVDMGRRDTMKVLGGGGLMVALAKIFPGIFKGGKAKVASKVAKTNYVKQFGNVRGMPDWFPSFMLKATQKGKLKSLPDKDYIYGTVYEVMLPVKKRLGKGKIKTEQVPVSVEVNPNTGTMTVRWTGTDNFGDDIERSINYKPGETGTQNYAADEYGRGTSKEEVVIQDPEFEYVEPDYTSMGPEDTSPDSAMSLDIYDEADEIVEAMEEFVKGADDKFKKKAADEFRLYNQTDEHLGDATGYQTSDGDWVSGDDNMPFPDYDKKTKDVYHRSEFDKSLDTKRKKKAMGGVASGPPPLSGPVPQGLPSLQPGDIYNEWIR